MGKYKLALITIKGKLKRKKLALISKFQPDPNNSDSTESVDSIIADNENDENNGWEVVVTSLSSMVKNEERKIEEEDESKKEGKCCLYFYIIVFTVDLM